MNRIYVFHEVKYLKTFISHLNFIKRKFNFSTLDNVLKNNDKKNNLCHITFDDGDISFNKVSEYLEKEKIHSTLFVSPKIISERKNYWFQDVENFIKKKINLVAELNNFYSVDIKDGSFIFPYLKTLKFYEIENFINFIKSKHKIRDEYKNISLNNLRDISRSKFIKIGSHTLNHPILSNETQENSHKEIRESKINLEQLLDCEINSFAYPNGLYEVDFGSREVEYIKKIYKTAVSMDLVMNMDHNYNFKLPRVPLFNKQFKNFFIDRAFKFYFIINKLRTKSKLFNSEESKRLRLIKKK